MINNKDMKQQTAVQLLIEQFYNNEGMLTTKQLETALELEKERIETAYDKGTVHGIDYPDSLLPLTGEHYYKQTYGDNK
jgi:hypothetical protein